MNTFLTKLAVTLVDGGSSINIPGGEADHVLKSTLNITYMIAGIIAVIVIILGGIIFSTSAGISGNVTKAKNMILYSVIGLILIIAAYAITNYVIGQF